MKNHLQLIIACRLVKKIMLCYHRPTMQKETINIS